jgi:hypothetical protein
MKPPLNMNLMNWAARLAMEATEKTSSELRPSADNWREIQGIRLARTP